MIERTDGLPEVGDEEVDLVVVRSGGHVLTER
jgi:hypothetical protein